MSFDNESDYNEPKLFIFPFVLDTVTGEENDEPPLNMGIFMVLFFDEKVGLLIQLTF